jgi:flavodoxin I
MKIGIFYGSSAGNTARIAQRAGELLGLGAESVHDIAFTRPEDFFSNECLVLGTSTWDIGKLQPDWMDFSGYLIPGSLQGKYCILFGLGDQGSYADTFADGLGILNEIVRTAGGNVLCNWPSDGYSFKGSKALHAGSFDGIVLDEDCQPELTEDRLREWVKIMHQSLKLI